MAETALTQEALDAQVESTILGHYELAGSSWVDVVKLYDGAGFRMEWTDGVTGHWVFDHPLLSVVLMRLATLAACGEVDFSAFFATDDEAFTVAALRFLEEQTTGTIGPTWHGGPAKPKIDYVGGDDPGAQWRLWIPPTSIWCFEGGTIDGALLGVWGNTYWSTHDEACQFLGQAVIEGKVPHG